MQTLQEVEEEIQAFAKASNEFEQNIAAGICPSCGKNLEPREQVGRCFYGACGCRIGQSF